jgi:hypothetical protein
MSPSARLPAWASSAPAPAPAPMQGGLGRPLLLASPPLTPLLLLLLLPPTLPPLSRRSGGACSSVSAQLPPPLAQPARAARSRCGGSGGGCHSSGRGCSGAAAAAVAATCQPSGGGLAPEAPAAPSAGYVAGALAALLALCAAAAESRPNLRRSPGSYGNLGTHKAPSRSHASSVDPKPHIRQRASLQRAGPKDFALVAPSASTPPQPLPAPPCLHHPSPHRPARPARLPTFSSVPLPTPGSFPTAPRLAVVMGDANEARDESALFMAMPFQRALSLGARQRLGRGRRRRG